jgi:hypothetical protein
MPYLNFTHEGLEVLAPNGAGSITIPRKYPVSFEHEFSRSGRHVLVVSLGDKNRVRLDCGDANTFFSFKKEVTNAIRHWYE